MNLNHYNLRMKSSEIIEVISNSLSANDYIVAVITHKNNDTWDINNIPIYNKCYANVEFVQKIVKSNANNVLSHNTMSYCMDINNFWFLFFEFTKKDNHSFSIYIECYNSILNLNTFKKYIIEDAQSYNIILPDFLLDYKNIILSFFELAEQINSQKVYINYLASINTKDIKGRQLSIVSTNKFSLEKAIQYSSLLTNLRTSELYAELKKESIKSAKAAIMARNISHNLGSHVMAYLKNKLGSVSDIVKQRALVELATTESISDLQNALKKYGTDALFSENIEFPFLVGLGYFISYLQEREDYIATVSTSYIPYYMSVNFKDSIYDALNPDLRYLRHQGRQGGKPDNILLSYIAKSEGFERPPYLNYKSYLDKNLNEKEKAELKSLDQFSRKNDIIIKFKKFDGINDKTYTDFVNGNIKIQVRSENGKGSGYLSLKEMRNYHIGLPGGISGRQALFSILENIIRNAAKHGNFHEVENLAITLDILDPLSAKDKNTCAKLWKKEPEDLDKLVDINDIYVMTITDNLKISQDKFEKLLEVLQDKYVNENGEMNNRAKGLKEMRISAAYIRRIEDEEKAEQEHRAPIINITLTEEQNLQYIICLPKAFKAAIILPNNDERIGKIQDKGNITFMSAESFKKSYNRCYDIIAIKKNDTTSFENICLSSPQRIIKAEDEELNKIKQIKDLSILYKQLVKEEETIYIMDHLFKNPDNLKAVENVMNMTNFHNKCLYQKHLENEKEFKGFINILTQENVGNKSLSQNPRPKFAEGISGSNSTDRLIRNDIIDELWYYKHLHAMQTQIAIFDERLFYHVSGLDDKLLLEQEVHSGDYQAVISAFKNVYIFNILFNDVNEQPRFDIYGYEDYDYTEEKISSVIKCIAHITFDNKTLKLDIINPKYKKSFNNISIHQGLLDKIYHQWNIDNNTAKDEVTNTLYDGFMTTDNSVIQLTVDGNDNKKVNKQFYPGMTIHSGRSKPSPQDMPQLIPFIQYASIENAFMDCKYILVELLELAQYE